MSSVESWEVWIALVEQDGTVPSHLYAQPVSHGRHIADLQKAIKCLFPNTLAHCDAASLRFRSQPWEADLQLRPSQSLADGCMQSFDWSTHSDENPIYCVVPENNFSASRSRTASHRMSHSSASQLQQKLTKMLKKIILENLGDESNDGEPPGEEGIYVAENGKIASDRRNTVNRIATSMVGLLEDENPELGDKFRRAFEDAAESLNIEGYRYSTQQSRNLETLPSRTWSSKRGSTSPKRKDSQVSEATEVWNIHSNRSSFSNMQRGNTGGMEEGDDENRTQQQLSSLPEVGEQASAAETMKNEAKAESITHGLLNAISYGHQRRSVQWSATNTINIIPSSRQQ